MYSLEISFDEDDLKTLSGLSRRIVFCKPPGCLPDIEESRWGEWLVWGSAAPSPQVRICWEQRYRLYASQIGPNAYREMEPDRCLLTTYDIYDRMLYSLSPSYQWSSDTGTGSNLAAGEYALRNSTMENNLTFGMAQAADFLGTGILRPLPTEAVRMINGETAVFTPHNHIAVCLRFDSRDMRRRSAGIVSEPLHLKFNESADKTVLKLRYNLQYNRFERI